MTSVNIRDAIMTKCSVFTSNLRKDCSLKNLLPIRHPYISKIWLWWAWLCEILFLVQDFSLLKELENFFMI